MNANTKDISSYEKTKQIFVDVPTLTHMYVIACKHPQTMPPADGFINLENSLQNCQSSHNFFDQHFTQQYKYDVCNISDHHNRNKEMILMINL